MNVYRNGKGWDGLSNPLAHSRRVKQRAAMVARQRMAEKRREARLNLLRERNPGAMRAW